MVDLSGQGGGHLQAETLFSFPVGLSRNLPNAHTIPLPLGTSS